MADDLKTKPVQAGDILSAPIRSALPAKFDAFQNPLDENIDEELANLLSGEEDETSEDEPRLSEEELEEQALALIEEEQLGAVLPVTSPFEELGVFQTASTNIISPVSYSFYSFTSPSTSSNGPVSRDPFYYRDVPRHDEPINIRNTFDSVTPDSVTPSGILALRTYSGQGASTSGGLSSSQSSFGNGTSSTTVNGTVGTGGNSPITAYAPPADYYVGSGSGSGVTTFITDVFFTDTYAHSANTAHDFIASGNVNDVFVTFSGPDADPSLYTHFYTDGVYKGTGKVLSDIPTPLFSLEIGGALNPGSNGTAYSPNHLDGGDAYIVTHSNLSQYAIKGYTTSSYHYALSSTNAANNIANAPELDWLSVGAFYYDDDRVSFFDLANPTTGNGNYNLSISASYSKLKGVDTIDAIGYGTNDIRLNKVAIDTMADDAYWTDNKKIITVVGDSNDTLTLTDQSSWVYTGIINNAAQTVDQYVFDGTDTYIKSGTQSIASTQSQFGSHLYQLTNGTTVLNFSANIGNHPDWYWAGTAGNDTVTLPDTQFGSIDGGAGIDTLYMGNLTAITADLRSNGNNLHNMEIINFAGNSTTDSITLDKAFVIGATDSNNLLSITGDASDIVSIADKTNWTWVGQVSALGTTVDQYKSVDGSATLNIQANLAGSDIFFNGDASNNIFSVPDVNFASLSAGAGVDTLKFSQAGTHDLSGLGSIISDLEIVDISGAASGLTLSADAIQASSDTGNWMAVLGDDGDSLSFSDASSWNFAGNLDASGIWPSLNVFKGTASDGTTIWAYAEQGIEVANVDATGTNANDIIRMHDNTFIDVDGGQGMDTLAFVKSGAIDLTNGKTIENIEIFDFKNGSANSVSIDMAFVDTNKATEFYILGDSNDTLTLDSAWTKGSTYAVNNENVISYSSTNTNGDAVTLYVSENMI